jgi:glycosyltransferase involved in cell wall biosynthesis
MLFRWIVFIRKSEEWLSKQSISDNYTHIIASDLYSLPIAARLKSVLSEKPRLIYDSREIYSALGSLSGRPLAQKIISLIEKKYVKQVDTVLASGQRDIDFISNRFPKSIDYHVLLNLPPYKKTEVSSYLRDRFNISGDKRIALYQGAVSRGRGLEKSIEAFSKQDKWSLCIVGGGPELSDYKELSRGLDNIHFTGLVPYSELHNITCSADIGLSLIEPISLSYKYALPNKLFEYFMAGLPVMATDMPPIEEVIEEAGGGLLICGELTAAKILSKLEEFEEKDIFIKLKNQSTVASEKYCYQSQHQLVQRIIS